MRPFVIVSLLCFFGLIQAAEAATNKPLRIVTSFSILADLTKKVGGDDVSVIPLVGPEQDAHMYQPTPDAVKLVADADMVVVNGLGFDPWMERLLRASGSHARLVVASSDLKSRVMTGPRGTPDPHAWQNVANARVYIQTIDRALETALPDDAKNIHARAVTYDQKLVELDNAIRGSFMGIDPAKKKVITSHDAFTYFGAAYGVNFIAPVGMNTEAEPSAADVARLINQIKQQNIKMIFLENMANPKLIKQIAKDSSAQIGGMLYADSLSAPNGPAPTYIGMMAHNTVLLKTAMTAH